MTLSSHLPSSPASISICSFSPAGGFSKKFPHLLRLRLNGIPQAAFLPPPLTVKEDRGPPLSLHASLSSRLCPSVLLSNPPLSLSFFLFPPAGLHFKPEPRLEEKKKKKRADAIRWLHSCTSLSVVETGSEGLTCSLRSTLSCAQHMSCCDGGSLQKICASASWKKGQIRKTPNSSQRRNKRPQSDCLQQFQDVLF